MRNCCMETRVCAASATPTPVSSNPTEPRLALNSCGGSPVPGSERLRNGKAAGSTSRERRSSKAHRSLTGASAFAMDRLPELRAAERCRSGRTGRSRKPLSSQGDRGFESLSLRHFLCALRKISSPNMPLRTPPVTRPRWRSHSLSNHGVAPDGRPIWLEPPHSGGQIGRDDRFGGWRLVA